MRTANFDIAIRYARPPFSGCDCRPFLADDMVPVAAPSLIDSAEFDAQGLPIGVPLMLDTYLSSDFDDWLRLTGHNRPPGLTAQNFSLYSMAVEATLNGRGFMMGHTSLIADLLAEGRLQPLSDKWVSAPNQFYLLTRTGVPLTPIAQDFVDWLLLEAGAASSGASDRERE